MSSSPTSSISGQTAVKQLQTCGVARDVATVALGRMKSTKLVKLTALAARFHLLRVASEQRVQTARFHFLSDAAVGVDVGNLTDGHHVAPVFHRPVSAARSALAVQRPCRDGYRYAGSYRSCRRIKRTRDSRAVML